MYFFYDFKIFNKFFVGFVNKEDFLQLGISISALQVYLDDHLKTRFSDMQKL